MEQRIRFCEVEGHRIAWASVGSGPPLLVPAPWAGNLHAEWEDPEHRRFIEALAAQHTVIRYDRPDTVVSTLVLCTVDDLDATLSEARRVLKPGGRLLFIEHVAAAEAGRLQRWQDRAHGFWHGFAYGCNTNRRTEEAIRRAGFEVDELVVDELEFDIPLIRPLIWGQARAPLGAEGVA